MSLKLYGRDPLKMFEDVFNVKVSMEDDVLCSSAERKQEEGEEKRVSPYREELGKHEQKLFGRRQRRR